MGDKNMFDSVTQIIGFIAFVIICAFVIFSDKFNKEK